MKVYDLFPFYNELDLLELRLAELDPVVDVFGLCELPVTFTDIPKPLYYRDNAIRFGHSKVNWWTPPAYPSGPHPTVDWFQRRELAKFIVDAEPDDVVILSDVDEIPDREIIKKYIEDGTEHPIVLGMSLFYHRVDLMDAATWYGSLICRRKNLGNEPDMEEFRKNRGNFSMVKGGWHFSWLGDGKAIADKLTAVDIERENAIFGAHGIQAPPSDPEFLQSCYEDGKDLFRRGCDKKQVPVLPGVTHPHEIAAWLRKFPQYGAP